eukprot:Lithocolla_globosa_v1_NODE_5080_length_1309_cov_78.456504.p1 type:complete len:122 gc:universal NODE_5080_length_1309_cov_78.456504:233-598(+)
MKKNSMNKCQLFVNEIQCSDYKGYDVLLTGYDDDNKAILSPTIDDYRQEDNIVIPNDALYKEYQAWSKTNGFKCYDSNALFKKIKDPITEIRRTISGKRVRCKVIPVVEVEEGGEEEEEEE